MQKLQISLLQLNSLRLVAKQFETWLLRKDN